MSDTAILLDKNEASGQTGHSASSGGLSAKETILANTLELDESCLRGVGLPDMLRGGGKLFADNAACARDNPRGVYDLSQPVRQLNYFLSHSWRTARWLKYLALVMHFNALPATLIMLVASFIVFYATLLFPEWVPHSLIVSDVSYIDGHPIQFPCVNMLLCWPLFFVLLFTAHWVRPDVKLFLDICCIPQEDGEKKARGIDSLGAVLDRSETLLVLLDEHYLTRLWCLFEVAGECHMIKLSPTCMLCFCLIAPHTDPRSIPRMHSVLSKGRPDQNATGACAHRLVAVQLRLADDSRSGASPHRLSRSRRHLHDELGQRLRAVRAAAQPFPRGHAALQRQGASQQGKCR